MKESRQGYAGCKLLQTELHNADFIHWHAHSRARKKGQEVIEKGQGVMNK